MLRYLWAAPASLVGFVLALGFRRWSWREGVLLAEGARWPRRLGWRYRAITFGHVVLCVDEISDDVFAHERVHVRQYETWGPFFLPAYLVASFWTRLRGKHHYRDNPFEIAARRGAGRPGGRDR